jgi:hypothetical protein
MIDDVIFIFPRVSSILEYMNLLQDTSPLGFVSPSILWLANRLLWIHAPKVNETHLLGLERRYCRRDICIMPQKFVAIEEIDGFDQDLIIEGFVL